MTKVLSFGLACFALFSVEARAQNPRDAVVYIQVGVTDPFTQASQPLAAGSGFLIDKQGHIITARHVVMHMEREKPGPRRIMVSLRDRDASPFPATVVACEAGDIDLCLVKISNTSVAAANITTVFSPVCRHLGSNEEIRSYGYAYGQNPAIGVPGEVTGDLSPTLKYPSNVQIVPGMSGGPVVDKGGQAIAVNAAGVEGMPTLTFLQPLIYGEGLIRRAGVSCVSPTPAAAPASPPPPSPTTSAAGAVTCPDRIHRIDRVQLSQNEAGPSLRQYSEAIQADTGCRIASVVPNVRSANNSTDPVINLGPDGAAAVVSYSLTSGPFFDRYRGWLNAELSVKQVPKS